MNTPSFMRGFVQAVASWRVVGSCGFTASLMPPHASPGPFHPRPLFPVHVCDWWHAEKSTVFLLLCCFPQALLVVCSDIPGKKKKIVSAAQMRPMHPRENSAISLRISESLILLHILSTGLITIQLNAKEEEEVAINVFSSARVSKLVSRNITERFKEHLLHLMTSMRL